MSKPTLYIRNESPPSRSDRSLHPGFHLEGSFSSYSAAVLEGQRLGGYSNFYIDTGVIAPSREDQLLLEPRKLAKRKNPKLEAAQLQD